jgi:hypothetical protein
MTSSRLPERAAGRSRSQERFIARPARHRAAMNYLLRIGRDEERAARLPRELRDNFVNFLRTADLRRSQLQRRVLATVSNDRRWRA